MTETASLAHYVLPATTPLQRPDLPFVFPLLLGMQARPYLQATDAVVPPDDKTRSIGLRLGTTLCCSQAGKMKLGTQAPPSITISSVTRMARPRVVSGVRPMAAIISPKLAVTSA